MVYLPKEIFTNILSFCGKTDKEKHKDKQQDINDFFEEYNINKKMTIEEYENTFNSEIDEYSLKEELYDWILEEMNSYEKSQDITLYLLH